MEWSYMGIVRTGAGGAVATKYLARKDARSIGVIGTGAIARYGLLAHSAMQWPIDKVFVYSRSPQLRNNFAAEMSSRIGSKVVAVDDPEPVVRESEILITGTSSHDCVLKSEWVRPGTYINGLGRETEIDLQLGFARAISSL
jgi:ornithine cyclodeaminase/alanine dehydrogenase-like protein (mu-crystallin family)